MSERERLRVLVVDDDAVMRDLLGLLLMREGYAAESAESGEEALERLRRGRVDVVLADLQMPGVAGSALAEEARTAWNSIRIIAMSGSVPEAETLRHFDGFLRKPFTIEELNGLLARKKPDSKKQRRVRSSEVIVDEKIYQQLAGSLGERKLVELYLFCIEDTKRRTGLLSKAAAHGEESICRREAHAIKGSCGMVGAREVEALAEAIEREGMGIDPAVTVDGLLQACNRLEGMLFERRNSSTEMARRDQG